MILYYVVTRLVPLWWVVESFWWPRAGTEVDIALRRLFGRLGRVLLIPLVGEVLWFGMFLGILNPRKVQRESAN
jgi:hypothetical protein